MFICYYCYCCHYFIFVVSAEQVKYRMQLHCVDKTERVNEIRLCIFQDLSFASSRHPRACVQLLP